MCFLQWTSFHYVPFFLCNIHTVHSISSDFLLREDAWKVVFFPVMFLFLPCLDLALCTFVRNGGSWWRWIITLHVGTRLHQFIFALLKIPNPLQASLSSVLSLNCAHVVDFPQVCQWSSIVFVAIPFLRISTFFLVNQTTISCSDKRIKNIHTTLEFASISFQKELSFPCPHEDHNYVIV
jgi:hypothetical protein